MVTDQPCCDYTKTDEIARAVKKVANRNAVVEKYTARPWNCYRTNELYWLVPSTEWPAYPYGKAFFKFEEGNPNYFFIRVSPRLM